MIELSHSPSTLNRAEVLGNIITVALQQKYPGLTKKLKFSLTPQVSEEGLIYSTNYSIEDNKILDLKDLCTRIKEITQSISQILPHEDNDRVYSDIMPRVQDSKLYLALKNEEYPQMTDKYRNDLVRLGSLITVKKKSRSIRFTITITGPVAQ